MAEAFLGFFACLAVDLRQGDCHACGEKVSGNTLADSLAAACYKSYLSLNLHEDFSDSTRLLGIANAVLARMSLQRNVPQSLVFR
jgi:hypothetical protein